MPTTGFYARTTSENKIPSFYPIQCIENVTPVFTISRLTIVFSSGYKY